MEAGHTCWRCGSVIEDTSGNTLRPGYKAERLHKLDCHIMLMGDRWLVAPPEATMEDLDDAMDAIHEDGRHGDVDLDGSPSDTPGSSQHWGAEGV